MIKEVKERRVSVEAENNDYFATIRDGIVVRLANPYIEGWIRSITTSTLEAYITFLQEVIQAIKETS